MRAAALLLLALFVAGCSSTKQTTSTPGATPEDRMREFEETFNPSDNDPMRVRDADQHPRPVDTATVEAADNLTTPASQEMVQGYRVQVFATASIDEARAKKAEFESLFPNESFYLEYDTPTYKLRAGNFVERFEADRFARELAAQGVRNAWAVPQRVFKSPPKRTPSPVIPPEEPK